MLIDNHHVPALKFKGRIKLFIGAKASLGFYRHDVTALPGKYSIIALQMPLLGSHMMVCN